MSYEDSARRKEGGRGRQEKFRRNRQVKNAWENFLALIYLSLWRGNGVLSEDKSRAGTLGE